MAGRPRTKEMLLAHMREAEERAAAGGHELGSWQPITQLSLFSHRAECKLCGRAAYAASNALYVAFARKCPVANQG